MDFAPQVKDATETIQLIPNLISAVETLFKTPTGWAIFFVVVVWFFINKDRSHLFDLFSRKDRKRAEHIDAYLSKADLADSDSMRVFRDMRDTYYFKIATGIHAEQRRREALVRLHKQISTTWVQIRRANEYIELTDKGEANVRDLTRSEKLGSLYNKSVGYLSLVAAAVFFSAGLMLSKTPPALIFLCVASLMSVALSMFAFSRDWPENAAKAIREELAKKRSSGDLRLVEQEKTGT